MAFLLMLMFASISGAGVLILDELSIMDEGVLDALLEILKENGDEYDMAVLACVRFLGNGNLKLKGKDLPRRSFSCAIGQVNLTIDNSRYGDVGVQEIKVGH